MQASAVYVKVVHKTLSQLPAAPLPPSLLPADLPLHIPQLHVISASNANRKVLLLV